MENKQLEEVINQLRPISLNHQFAAFFIYTVDGKYYYASYANLNNLGDNVTFILMMISGQCLNIRPKKD